MEISIENKLIKAEKTFHQWKKISFSERQKFLQKLSKVLLKNKEKFAKIITNEMNKPISQSIAEIEKCALMIDYYAKAENVLKPE